VITCPKCSKDNQDHYKFCLGCGAELPRDAAPQAFLAADAPAGHATPSRGRFARSVSTWGHRGHFTAASACRPGARARGACADAAGSAAHLIGTLTAPVAANGDCPRPPPAAAPAAAMVALPPVRAHERAEQHLFCGSCGFRLGGAAARPSGSSSRGAGPLGAGGAASPWCSRRCAPTAPRPAPSSCPAAGTVGRETGGIFAGDSYLSPRHATFRALGPGRATVKDEASLNGVYKKLTRDVPVELKPQRRLSHRPGDHQVRAAEPTRPPRPDGVERLGAPSKGYIGRIALVIGREETGNAFPIPRAACTWAASAGDILFPEDGYVSGCTAA
jgi:hypothetical protein